MMLVLVIDQSLLVLVVHGIGVGVELQGLSTRVVIGGHWITSEETVNKFKAFPKANKLMGFVSLPNG